MENNVQERSLFAVVKPYVGAVLLVFSIVLIGNAQSDASVSILALLFYIVLGTVGFIFSLDLLRKKL